MAAQRRMTRIAASFLHQRVPDVPDIEPFLFKKEKSNLILN
jgi:hypothetical protein